MINCICIKIYFILYIYALSLKRENFSIQEVAEDLSPVPPRSLRLVRPRLSPRSFRRLKNRARQWDEIATIVSHSLRRCKRNPDERSARRERKVPRPLSGSLFYLAPCYIRWNVFYCVLSRDKLFTTIYRRWRCRVVPNFIFKIHCLHILPAPSSDDLSKPRISTSCSE